MIDPRTQAASIEVCTEDQGCFVDQYVAQKPSERAGDCPHDDSNPPGEACGIGLRYTYDHEESEADGVKDEEGVIEADNLASEDDREDKSESRDDQIGWLDEPERLDI